jgi:hypothetical protein
MSKFDEINKHYFLNYPNFFKILLNRLNLNIDFKYKIQMNEFTLIQEFLKKFTTFLYLIFHLRQPI